MSAALATLMAVFTDAGHKGFEDADRRAKELYAQVRREVLDDLARSGTGLAELEEYVHACTFETAADTKARAADLFHTIRGAALLAAAEQLVSDAENAVQPKVSFALGWAARRVHKMIINPEGTQHGETQQDGEGGELRSEG